MEHRQECSSRETTSIPKKCIKHLYSDLIYKQMSIIGIIYSCIKYYHQWTEEWFNTNRQRDRFHTKEILASILHIIISIYQWPLKPEITQVKLIHLGCLWPYLFDGFYYCHSLSSSWRSKNQIWNWSWCPSNNVPHSLFLFFVVLKLSIKKSRSKLKNALTTWVTKTEFLLTISM